MKKSCTRPLCGQFPGFARWFCVTITAGFLLCMTMGLAMAQQVTGVITNQDGAGLPGVNVVVKGTNRGVTSDRDGKFSISADRTSTLVFSYIGYNTQEIAVGTRSVIDIRLTENEQALSEVVVVGYDEGEEYDEADQVQQQDEAVHPRQRPLVGV